jgi:hypothetical protein
MLGCRKSSKGIILAAKVRSVVGIQLWSWMRETRKSPFGTKTLWFLYSVLLCMWWGLCCFCIVLRIQGLGLCEDFQCGWALFGVSKLIWIGVLKISGGFAFCTAPSRFIFLLEFIDGIARCFLESASARKSVFPGRCKILKVKLDKPFKQSDVVGRVNRE